MKMKVKRLPIWMSKRLMESDIAEMELSVRANNVLKRAGIFTVGELVERIEGPADLRKMRNCGESTTEEIMSKLFNFQCTIMEPEKRERYLKRVQELNQ